MRDDPSTRSRRAFLGLTAGALAGIAGCIGDLGAGAGDGEPSPSDPTESPTDGSTPTSPGSNGSPTPVDPEDVTLTDASVQSSGLGEHVMGGYLDVRTSDGWLVYVSIGTDEHTPEGNSVAHRTREGYPEAGALRLAVQAGDVVKSYEESRRRNYRLAGDAAGAWTTFEVPAGIQPDAATVEWPVEERTLGELSGDALSRLSRNPPAFTLESFLVGEPGTTPGPTPHGSPTVTHDDFPTTTVDYELRVRNEGGAGTFRGVLDHETPKEEFTADYSQGDVRVAGAFDAGETRTLTGEYTLYHYEEQETVQVRAETAGGEATSRAATDD